MTLSADHFKCDPSGDEYAGDHLLLELWGAEHLSDGELIQRALETSAKHAGATLLHSHYHHFGPDQGVSGVTVLAESHITIHTWPERAYAAVDIFMCGDCDPLQCIPHLEQTFRPSRMSQRLFRRGLSAAGLSSEDVAA